ncbi:MAG: hypothetical protein ACRD1E_09280 [Terriglobales bacterium]
MNRTAENLLTWAPLGAGLALMLSEHQRLGLMVAAVSPITVAAQHPRATRRALKKVPRAFEEFGKAMTKGTRKAGYGLKWMVG